MEFPATRIPLIEVDPAGVLSLGISPSRPHSGPVATDGRRIAEVRSRCSIRRRELGNLGPVASLPLEDVGGPPARTRERWSTYDEVLRVHLYPPAECHAGSAVRREQFPVEHPRCPDPPEDDDCSGGAPLLVVVARAYDGNVTNDGEIVCGKAVAHGIGGTQDVLLDPETIDPLEDVGLTHPEGTDEALIAVNEYG